MSAITVRTDLRFLVSCVAGVLQTLYIRRRSDDGFVWGSSRERALRFTLEEAKDVQTLLACDDLNTEIEELNLKHVQPEPVSERTYGERVFVAMIVHDFAMEEVDALSRAVKELIRAATESRDLGLIDAIRKDVQQWKEQIEG